MFTRWLTDDSQIHKSSAQERTQGRRRIRLASLLLIVAIALSLAGCSLLPSELDEEEVPVIKPPRLSEKPTYDVTTGTIIDKVRGSGKIMSMQEEPLYFTLEGGYRIKEIHVQTGEEVQAGQMIAELDVQHLIDQLRRDENNFKQEEYNMKLKLRDSELTEQELEEAKVAFEAKRLNLVEQREKIERAKIYAPFSGTIISISTKPGDSVQAYAPIVVLADMNQLIVAVTIGRDDLQRVAVGMEASVSINAAGTHIGKIDRLPGENSNQPRDPWNPQPRQDTIDNYLLIKLSEFPTEVTRATPLSAEVIVERKENVIIVPPSVIRTYGGRTYVQVAESDGTKREVDIEVGQQTPTQVEIVRGLESGMKVVGR